MTPSFLTHRSSDLKSASNHPKRVKRTQRFLTQRSSRAISRRASSSKSNNSGPTDKAGQSRDSFLVPAEPPRSMTSDAATSNSNLWTRSEHHTSELQSLMRNSSALFFLTKHNFQPT